MEHWREKGQCRAERRLEISFCFFHVTFKPLNTFGTKFLHLCICLLGIFLGTSIFRSL